MNYFLKAWQNYVNFEGRSSRKEYWYFVLFNILSSWLVGFIARATGIMELSMLYSLAALLPGLAVGVRRMHDVGKSGWFILIPIYNLVLYCTEGDKGNNEYGEEPTNELD